MDLIDEMAEVLLEHHVSLDDWDACQICLLDAGYTATRVSVNLKEAIDCARFLRDEEEELDQRWEAEA